MNISYNLLWIFKRDVPEEVWRVQKPPVKVICYSLCITVIFFSSVNKERFPLLSYSVKNYDKKLQAELENNEKKAWSSNSAGLCSSLCFAACLNT